MGKARQRRIGWGFVVLAAAFLLTYFLAREREAPLNLILVCVDTVRYDTFWLAESAGLEDPLSFWEKSAIRLRRVQTVSPWTVPSVASVMTGLLPQTHGAGRFPQAEARLDQQTPSGLPAHIPTLASLLAARGYHTVNITAHAWMLIPELGLARGFQKTVDPGDEDVLEEAFRWLLGNRSSSRQPFFMNLHLMAAHGWHRRPASVLRHNVKELKKDLEAAARRTPTFALAAERESEALRFLEYVRAVSELRARVAKLLATLAESALLSSTVVLLYSDHGEEFGDHLEAERSEGLDPRGYYGIGHGHSLYQELLHVPVLAWVPGQPGLDFPVPASLVDITPTLLAWMNLGTEPAGSDGLNLRPVIKTTERWADFEDRPLFATGIAYGKQKSAVVAGRWKLIFSHHEGGRHVLFDLDSDPEERRPLDPAADVVAQRLLALLQKEVAAAADGQPAPVISEEFLERLRALGYVSSPKR